MLQLHAFLIALSLLLAASAHAQMIHGDSITTSSGVQGFDADLTDLADGSLTGSKVGAGVPWANLANVPAGFADGVDDTGGAGGATLLRVTADVANTTTTFANVTGLTLTVNASTTYYFECFLTYTTAVSTTALQMSVNGPAATALDYAVEVSTTATAWHSSGQTAYDTVTNPATGAAAVKLPVRLHGSLIVGGSGGTFAVRSRSEVAASAATVKRGSWCRVGT